MQNRRSAYMLEIFILINNWNFNYNTYTLKSLFNNNKKRKETYVIMVKDVQVNVTGIFTQEL